MVRMNNSVDSQKVRRAFGHAGRMKWVFPLFPFVVLLAAAGVAFATQQIICLLIGLLVALFGSGAFFLVGIRFCRCPVCGQRWWSPLSLGFGWLSMLMNTELGGDETETYRCRRCGLEIGPHLKRR